MSRSSPPLRPDISDNLDLAVSIIQGGTLYPNVPQRRVPGISDACIDVLANALHAIRRRSVDYSQELVDKHPRFTFHIARWALTQCGSPVFLNSLKARWMECKCVLGEESKSYHFHTHQDRRMTKDEMAARFYVFAESLYQLIVDLTAILEKAGTRATRKLIGRIGMDTSSTLDAKASDRAYGKNAGLEVLAKCLALEPRSLICSCMSWLKMLPGIASPVIVLSHALAYVEGPSAEVYFQTLRKIPGFPWVLFALLKTQFSACEKGAGPPSTFRDHLRLQSQLVIQYILALYRSSNPTMEGYFTPDADWVFTSVYEITCSLAPGNQSLSSVEGTLDSSVLDLVQMAKDMYPLVKNDLPNAAQMYRRLLQQPVSTRDEHIWVVALLLEISRIQGLKRCMNQACWPDSGSTECQQAGWKDAQHPHKASCKKLKTIRSVWRWDQHLDIAPHLYEMGPREGREQWLIQMLESVGITRDEEKALQIQISPSMWNVKGAQEGVA